MTLRIVPLAGLLLAALAAGAQNNLFSTSTTSPAAKAGKAPQPIEVLAGSGAFSLKDEYALYRGEVRVNDAQFFLSCENLRLNLDMKPAKSVTVASTNAAGQVMTPLTAPMGGRVRSAEADGGVVFSNKVDASQAFANRAVYQASNDAFVLTGKAKVIRGTITTWADQITYFRAKGDFDAVGNLRMEYGPPSTNAAPKKP